MIRPSTLIRHSPDQTPGRDTWQDRAACQDLAGPWDYDASPEDHAWAIDVCWNVCPVQQQCADYRKDIKPDGGIWGGELLQPKKQGCKGSHDTTDPDALDSAGRCRQCRADKRKANAA